MGILDTYYEWNLARYDHRGDRNWLKGYYSSDGDDLRYYANMGAYERERELEDVSSGRVSFIEDAYPVLRGARITGFLDFNDNLQCSDEVLAVAAEACRIEAIPVVQDFNKTMHNAIRSYGKLLSSLHRPTYSYSTDKSEYRRMHPENTEQKWYDELGAVVRTLVDHKTSILDDLENSHINKKIDLFNGCAHHYPDLLQAFLTLADHFGVVVPNTYPLRQPDVKLWNDFNVTSANFLQSIISQPSLFHAMSGHQFEQVVCEVFKRNGLEVIMTKRSRDGGVDLFLVVPIINQIKATYLVECKNPKQGKPVGVSVIRGLRGISDALLRKTAGGIVVTSTTFSEDAKKEAEASGWDLSLFDSSDLLELLTKAITVTDHK